MTVTVSDGNGGSDTITVTINITDVAENSAPVFTEGASTTRTVELPPKPENPGTWTSVCHYSPPMLMETL